MPNIDPCWSPVEGQDGLYIETYTITNPFTGLPLVRRILHSADGYCFYCLYDEYVDEEGNIIPEEDVTPMMRHYCQYMSLTTSMDLAMFISVPVQEGFEIVSTKPNHETV